MTYQNGIKTWKIWTLQMKIVWSDVSGETFRNIGGTCFVQGFVQIRRYAWVTIASETEGDVFGGCGNWLKDGGAFLFCLIKYR